MTTIGKSEDDNTTATLADAAPEKCLDSGMEKDLAAVSEISEEEKREIRLMIDGIAEKNRNALFVAGGGAAEGSWKSFKAKKHGGLFPVLVNVFAALALAGGFFALWSLQSEADVQAREGTRVFSDTERRLIDEIRRETSASLAAKDLEINMLLASLSDIEAQLKALALGGEALTPEQLEIQERLVSEQEERRAELAIAREDRSRILDGAWSRETTLRAQLVAVEERRQGDDELDAARAELAELARDQAQAAAMESQVTGLFAGIYRQVAESNFFEAEQTIGNLREFLDAPAFQAVRGVQSRREVYVQAANTLETLLDIAYEAMRDGPPPPDGNAEARHLGEIERLEGVVAELAAELAHRAEHAMEAGRLQEENVRLQEQLNQLRQVAEQLLQLQQVLPQ
ncbi:MAG: hypothetical protein FWB79_05910 [Treponema sp.]|nr:hypothetical protein [Treponema sp.]